MEQKNKQIDLAKQYRRKECEDLLKRKFFFVPSFEIYNGVAGLYDYGPLGSCLKGNVEQLWRQHFILEEDMLEVSCTSLTPEEVLKTSGHVEKFADFMVKDAKTGAFFRADKLIEEHVAKVLAKKKDIKPEERERLQKIIDDAGQMQAEELNKVIKELGMKSPDTQNELTEAALFNLMFETQIGPSGYMKAYMRPETAQGIFINFKRLLEYNNGKMPFAAAQIGLGFRNEIHPKQGLLRVREFSMAEIEHFVDPTAKDHPRFYTEKDAKLPLFTKQNQETTRELIKDMTLEKAVESGVIDNQTLAYFMARTYAFLKTCGIKEEAIRFRQHRDTEMAHYAKDCWDAEVETSYGWIEIAGHADRSCFDLNRHAQRTKTELKATKMLKEPVQVKFIKVTVDKKEIGKSFRADSKVINETIEAWTEDEKEKFLNEMQEKGEILLETPGDKKFKLPKGTINLEAQEKKVLEEKYTPSVIEPSFGIGRIIYCIFEHCFKVRAEDQARTYFDFPPLIAPLKCSLLPLMSNTEFNKVVQDLKRLLTKSGISSKIDDSTQTIGRRYARTDECGIPFAITVDFDTLKDNTVTVRELDSMKQVRVKIDELANLITQCSLSQMTWEEVMQKYPAFSAAAEPKE